MKEIFILSAFLIQFSFGYCQEESEIYQYVLSNYALGLGQIKNDKPSDLTLLILNKAKYMSNLKYEDFNWYKSKYKKFNQNTFNNYIEVNKKELGHINVELEGVEVAIIDTSLTSKTKELITTYPEWNYYILELSNIGFNETKTQALIYYAYYLSPVGGGIYIIFEKKRKKWKKVKVIPSWAA